jgi:hypothetical protein
MPVEEIVNVDNGEIEIVVPDNPLAPVKYESSAKTREQIIARDTEGAVLEDILGISGILIGFIAIIVFLFGGIVQLLGGESCGLFNLIMTAITLGGGVAPFMANLSLEKRRNKKFLTEPLNKAELALAKKIETHNLRLEAYKNGSFTGEEKNTITRLLATDKENIVKKIDLLKKARTAEATAKKLRANPSLPMTDEIDMLLAAGVASRIEEITDAAETPEFLDEPDNILKLTA